MKDTILFKIGSIFICLTELGNVVAIQDTEDNRNPDRGALTRMGVNSFEAKERTAPTILTSDNVSEVVKNITAGLGNIFEPLMERLKSAEQNLADSNKKLDDLESRFKMLWDSLETKKAEKLIADQPRTLVKDEK